MMGSLPVLDTASKRATLAYIAPFVVFVGCMTVQFGVHLPAHWYYPARFLAVLLTIGLVSRPVLRLRAGFPLASVGIGIAVFLIWIGPDALWGYRHHWLFDNFIAGTAASSVDAVLKQNVMFVGLRVAVSVALVPVLEELFWRGWLMRWLISQDFLKVPMGTYARNAFWIVALLFASEHGPYWEVGLAAGIVYNWWMVRTRNLADCILAHAVTNGLLSVYVLMTGQWEYWL
jgi:hypothetical protein